jgi:predicted ArsR family transcriptional regulator
VHAVRKHILEILKEQNQGATVAELAEALEMAPVSVRHHLDILQGDNLICVDRLERKGSVGRPQQIYALTEEALAYFPNNFAALAGKLVDQIKQMLPPEQVPCAFRAMAQEMAAECSGLHAELPRRERLKLITDFLNTHGYLARWEEVTADTAAAACEDDAPALPFAFDEGDFLLHKYNCPYAGVSSDHGELCLMDQTLIDELVGEPCERVSAMSEGASCCTYRVGSRSHAVADSEISDHTSQMFSLRAKSAKNASCSGKQRLVQLAS